MHPLIRDDWHLRALADDHTLREVTFRDLAGPDGTKLMSEVDTTDLLYSFGTLPPGLVTLHNFPKFLQEYQRPDGKLQDLAATDLLRTRELGVPRYNEFRRLLHLEPATSFEELTGGNTAWARQIEQAYGGDLEQVDVTVGMCAERLPAGFAFSDTAFRIFVLMASRRLNSDRFFTDYYTRGVHARGTEVDRRHQHGVAAAQAPPGAAPGAGGGAERVRTLERDEEVEPRVPAV